MAVAPLSFAGRPAFRISIAFLPLLLALPTAAMEAGAPDASVQEFSLTSGPNTIRLTLKDGSSCTAVTSVAGVRANQAADALVADGVVFSGSGCGGDNSLSVNLNVPPTGFVNSPINVSWTAAQGARYCTYAGVPRSGLTGWDWGQLSCSGMACPGTHHRTLYATEPGVFQLTMVCTNESGYATATVNIVP